MNLGKIAILSFPPESWGYFGRIHAWVNYLVGGIPKRRWNLPRMHAYQLGCKMKTNKKSPDPAGKCKKKSGKICWNSPLVKFSSSNRFGWIWLQASYFWSLKNHQCYTWFSKTYHLTWDCMAVPCNLWEPHLRCLNKILWNGMFWWSLYVISKLPMDFIFTPLILRHTKKHCHTHVQINGQNKSIFFTKCWFTI